MSKQTSRILSSIMFQINRRPSVDIIGAARYRQLLEKSARVFKPDPGIRTDRFDINGIPAEWLIPKIYTPRSVIFYIHGGGFITGSIRSHRDLASRLATAARAKVLIFNYRLAPEHPFPAGLDDVRQVYSWLLCTCDTDYRICIAGDSAGGNLALSLLAEQSKDSRSLPVCTVLFSPWTDLSCSSGSHESNRKKDFMLNKKTLETTARFYTDQDLSNPLISPIHHRFEGLPPLLIQVGENEVLLDDSVRLANKIKQEGGIVQLEVWNGMFHVWHYFAKYLSEARDAIKDAGRFIQKHTHPSRSTRSPGTESDSVTSGSPAGHSPG